MLNIANKFLKCELNFPVLTVIRELRRKTDVGLVLADQLKNLKKQNPLIDFKVDIGLPIINTPKRKELNERFKYLKERKNNAELERKSRTLTLNPDYESIRQEWVKTDAPKHIQTIAEHYNIFEDLFGDAYFTPHVVMDIYYPQRDRGQTAPVCRGNVVKPAEAFLEPVVKFESKSDELWTLTLVNPDGHLTINAMEYVHWAIGNIPGGDVSKGEVLWDYLPPFPPRGLGFQRFVFVLYKQNKKMDYSKLKQQLPCLELKNRSFKTLEFYRERQDDITPAGLSFFQSDWDKSSRKVYHEILNMEEPVFEYEFPPKLYNPQEWFAKKKPFDLYLDRYRDPRDIAQELLEKKMKEVDPFKPPKKRFPYPRAARLGLRNLPSWLVTKELRYRMGRGRVTEIQRDEYEK